MVLGQFIYKGETLRVYTNKYTSNDRLAVLVEGTTDGAPYCMLSTNVEDVPLAEEEFILNHDLLRPSFLPFFAALGSLELFVETGKMCNYGFCRDIPIWKLK